MKLRMIKNCVFIWNYWIYQNALIFLWTEEVMNDMFEVSVANDKLSLMYEENKKSFVAINTPLGLTQRIVINNIEMQGGVLAPLTTAVQIDSIGKECLTTGENLFKYKKIVSVPPLSFIDDIFDSTRISNSNYFFLDNH